LIAGFSQHRDTAIGLNQGIFERTLVFCKRQIPARGLGMAPQCNIATPED